MTIIEKLRTVVGNGGLKNIPFYPCNGHKLRVEHFAKTCVGGHTVSKINED